MTVVVSTVNTAICLKYLSDLTASICVVFTYRQIVDVYIAITMVTRVKQLVFSSVSRLHLLCNFFKTAD